LFDFIAASAIPAQRWDVKHYATKWGCLKREIFAEEFTEHSLILLTQLH